METDDQTWLHMLSEQAWAIRGIIILIVVTMTGTIIFQEWRQSVSLVPEHSEMIQENMRKIEENHRRVKQLNKELEKISQNIRIALCTSNSNGLSSVAEAHLRCSEFR